MKRLRIRKFIIFVMMSIFILPMFSYLIVHFLDTGTLLPWEDPQSQQNAAVEQAIRLISTNDANWQDPAWQSTLRTDLQRYGVDAIIVSASGQEIFKSASVRQWMPDHQQISVVDNGRSMGTIQLYTHGTNDVVARVTAGIVMVLAILFRIGFQMQRHVINPLESMSRAAGKIAEGDLDFELPISRVTEIDEVRVAFYTMVAGLRESFAKQTKLEEERRFFIGAIAHDLRTPLFALRGYLDGLEQGLATTPEKMGRYVAVCKQKASQLDRLVADLFAFTKLEFREQTPRQDEVSFSDVVNQSVDSLRPLAEEKGIAIHLEAPGGACLVKGDALLLERAVNNLLENALRYTPANGTVLLKWYREAGRTFVTVRDTGPGFAPQDIEHIFEPLYRGDASRNSATGGTGLGLTIAKRIFKAHGGDLAVGNQEDGGAVVTGWVVED